MDFARELISTETTDTSGEVKDPQSSHARKLMVEQKLSQSQKQKPFKILSSDRMPILKLPFHFTVTANICEKIILI
jgi:hypothetical protein